MNSVEKTKYRDLAFFFALVLFAALMVYKAFHAVCENDETTIIFSAFRHMKGARLSLEDSLVGMFVFPVVKLWYAVTGSTEGVVLFSRLSFVAVQTMCAVFLYSRLRTYGNAAVPAVLVFFFNVPLWSMTLLYYNTVLVMTTGIVAVLVLSVIQRCTRLRMFFLGVAVAVAVVCSPFLSLLYFCYTVGVAVCFIRSKKRPGSFSAPDALKLRSWLFVTLGVVLTAAAVVVYLFKGTTPGQALEELSFLRGDDASVGALAGLFGAKDKLAPLIEAYLPLTLCVIIPPTLTALAAAFDKKRVAHGNYYVVAGSVICIACDAVILFYRFHFELSRALENILLLYVVFALYGLLCWLVTEKKERLLFAALFCGGLFTALLRSCESKMFIFGGASVMSLCLAGAVFLSEKKAEEVFARGGRLKKSLAVLMAAVMAAQLFSQVFIFLNMRFSVENHCGLSPVADKLDTRIETGPLKGIYTTAAMAAYYADILSDIETIKTGTEGPVLTTNEFSWIYLALEDRATPMDSMFFDNEWIDAEAMRTYYGRFPDTVPGCIYASYLDVSSAGSDFSLLPAHAADSKQQALFEEIIKNYPGSVTAGRSGYIIDLR